MFVGMALLAGCAGRQAAKGRDEAMRVGSVPKLLDDLTLETLVSGLRNQISIHQAQAKGQAVLTFGERKIRREQYAAALAQFADFLGTRPGQEQLQTWVDTHFEFHEVYGNESWGE